MAQNYNSKVAMQTPLDSQNCWATNQASNLIAQPQRRRELGGKVVWRSLRRAGWDRARRRLTAGGTKRRLGLEGGGTAGA